jgi:hypothetical protein
VRVRRRGRRWLGCLSHRGRQGGIGSAGFWRGCCCMVFVTAVAAAGFLRLVVILALGPGEQKKLLAADGVFFLTGINMSADAVGWSCRDTSEPGTSALGLAFLIFVVEGNRCHRHRHGDRSNSLHLGQYTTLHQMDTCGSADNFLCGFEKPRNRKQIPELGDEVGENAIPAGRLLAVGAQGERRVVVGGGSTDLQLARCFGNSRRTGWIGSTVPNHRPWVA